MNTIRVLTFALCFLCIFSVGQVAAADLTATGELRSGQTTDIDVTVTTGSEQTNVAVGLDLSNNTGATLSTNSLSYGTVDGTETKTVQVSTPLSEKDSASLKLTYTSDSETTEEIVQLSNTGKEYFSVINSNFDTPLGDPGYTEITVENVTSKQYSNARIVFDTEETPISIPQEQKTVYLGEISNNEQKTVNVETTVSENASSGFTYQLPSTIKFTDSKGTSVEEPLYVDIEPTEQKQVTTTIADSDIPIGGNGIVELEIQNTKNKDLSNTSLTVESNSTDLRFSDSDTKQVTIGELDSGEQKTVSLTASFSETAVEDFEYQVKSTIDFEYQDSSLNGSDTTTATITPTEKMENPLTIQDQTTPVGGSGSATFTFTNTNTVAIEDVQITLQSNNSKVAFDGQQTSTRSFERVAANESVTFTDEISFTESASSESNYTINATTQYNFQDINQNSTESHSLLVTPLSEQNVDIYLSENASVTEGDDVDLPVIIENTGPRNIEDIEFTITARNDSTVKQNTFSVADITEGEARTVQVPIETPIQSETLQQEFDTTVTYTYPELETPNSVSEIITVNVTELDGEFDVTTTNTPNVPTGSSEVITIQVTNQLSNPVSNVDAEFSASSPVSVTDSSAYVSEIESGETVNLNIEVEADGSATPNPYPVDVDFQYDNTDGNAQLSEVYSIQVNIIDSTSQSPFMSPFFILGALLTITGGIAYYYRKTLKRKLTS